MAHAIEVQEVGMAEAGSQTMPLTRVPLLRGAIEGVETNYCVQAEGEQSPCRPSKRARVILFTRGGGVARTGGKSFEFNQIAALVVPANGPLFIQATRSPLEYLEVLIDLRDDQESACLQSRESFFALYSQCEPYAEAIKSPRTVSRTIVPAGVVPRFCMGSVETPGPDAVDAHAHPMLEQLFFGLPGNACVVVANGVEQCLGELTLLHIPSASSHGVRVKEGRRMHYVWMDFFRNEEDLAYIQEQHKPIQR